MVLRFSIRLQEPYEKEGLVVREGNNNRPDRDSGRDPNDKRISNILRKTYEYLSKKSKAWKGAMMAFVVLIVFFTTYGLILPAITIEKDTVQEMPGMDLASDSSHDEEYRTSRDPAESNTAGQEVNESSGAKNEGDSSTEDKDSHENSSTSLQLAQSPLKYSRGSYDYELIFDKAARIPEGTIFTVEKVRKNSIEYTSYKKALEKSQALADLVSDDNDSSDGKDKGSSGSGTIVPKSFLRLKLYKDGEEIRPDQPVKLVIYDKGIETGKSDSKTSHPEYGVIFRTKASDKELTANLIKLKYDNDSSPITISSFPYNKNKTQPVIGLAYKKTDSQEQVGDQSGNREGGEKDSVEEGGTDGADGAEGEKDTETEGLTENIAYPEADFQAQTDHLDITVKAPEGALPEGTILRVREIKDEEALKAITETVENSESNESSDKKDTKDKGNKNNGKASKKEVKEILAVDITFTDKEGREIEPLKDVHVTISSRMVSNAAKDDNLEIAAVHLDDQGTGSLMDIEARQDSVSFESDSFSIYALVSYTVDYEYAVNGKVYQFSLPGDGFVSFTDLVEVLGIVGDANTDLALDDVEASETARKFAADVASVEFSNSELVDVSKVEADTTVGQIKESRKLECRYGTELTEEQIAEINAQAVEAGDWALISMQPFKTEETLTITMKDGQVFSIQITDDQVSDNVLTAEGKTYKITVTYDDKADIPEGSKLQVRQFAKKDAEYKKAKDLMPESAEDMLAFDISICDSKGNIVEPKDKVSVDISLISFPEEVDADLLKESMQVHHIVKEGKEEKAALVADTGVSSKGSIVVDEEKAEAEFTTDSFSVYTISWGNGSNQQVRLHFVNENGVDISSSGVTFNGTTFYNDLTVNPTSLVWDDNGELDLTQFEIDGYTLSNTHKSTWEDLRGPLVADDENWNGGRKANYPHTIIGNTLKWNGSTIQYKLYYANNDKAGFWWFDAGKEPKRGRQWWMYDYPQGSNHDPTDHTAVDDNDENPYDYYLVYSPTSLSGSGSGGNQDPHDLGELGHTKKKTSNYDGTYNLELGVSSKAIREEASNHVNILLVVDTSSSMQRRYDSEEKLTDYKTNPNSRIYQTEHALTSFVDEVLKANNTDPNAVELELITFDMGARVKQNWTKNKTAITNAITNMKNELTSGTNWAEAIELAQTEALAKAQNPADKGDTTYVLFLTDGAPSQYWSSSELTGYYVSGQGCYLGARDEARNAVLNGVNLYSIFSYGTNVDKTNDYLGSLMGYAYNDNSTGTVNEYRHYADTGSDLKDKLLGILKKMDLDFSRGEVQINDGITELTTVTFEHIDPESFEYNIKYKNYTDPEDPDEYTEVTLTNGHGITVTGQGSQQSIKISPVTYGTWQNGEYKTITTKEVTIKGAQFSGTPNKQVTWKLEKSDGGIYLLEDNWTYNVQFKIWPSQDSYDLLAALNNGFLEWGEDFVNGDHTIPADEYKDQIDNTATPYELKTNTDANVTFKEYTAKTDENGNTTYIPGEEKTVTLPTVSPMPLDNTEILLKKVWNTTLSQEDFVNIHSVDLYVLEDPTEAKIAAFNAAYETYKNIENPTAQDEAAFAATYYYKATVGPPNWEKKVSIAPGVYDQFGHMNTTGHTYMVLEPGIDNHYELEARPTHPMLNGLTHNADDPDTLKDMVDVYEYDTSSLDVDDEESYPPVYYQENQVSQYSVANTLKGGLNVNKVLDITSDERNAIEDLYDLNQFFEFEISLYDEGGNPVYAVNGDDGGGEVAFRIYAPASPIPEGAVETDSGYRINGLEYVAQMEGDTLTGYVARGPINSTGKVNLKIRECDSIRIVNVPMGTKYTVEEKNMASASSDFDFEKSEWRVQKKSGDNYIVPQGMSQTVTDSQITNEHEIEPDAENNVTFYNIPKEGALKLTKLVEDDSGSTDTAHIDGDYIFKVTSVAAVASGDSTVPIVTKYVLITVNNGTAVSYKIADTEEALETAQEEIGSSALITGLLKGDYKIEEVNKNGLMLTSFVRGDNNSNAVHDDDGTVTVHVTKGDTEAEQSSAQAVFTNSYFDSEGPDKIVLDIAKTFDGISSLSEIPDGADGFEVVIGYTLNGEEKTITLEKESNETNADGIVIKAETNGLTINWHITNVPNQATDFKIKEVHYNSLTDYDFISAALDGTDITSTAGDWHNMSVIAPTAELTNVTNERHTPDSEADLRYELQDSDILLSKLTANQGTLIISKKSLNSLEREAVVKGWPQQGGFKKPGIYFSIEEHPNGFSYGNKTVTFSEVDGKTYVTFTSNVAAQEAVFAVTYDSHAELNNASLTNTYNQKEVALDIVKVKKDEAGTKLSDAQFVLRKLTNDTETGYPVPTDTGTFDGEETADSPVTTNADGEGSFTGLTQGYYELSESKAPDGYVMANNNPVYIRVHGGVISWVEWSEAQSKWVDKNTGSMVSFEAATAAVEDDLSTPDNESAAAKNARFTVENEPGEALPNSGGPGIKMFYLLGLILITGMGLLLLRKRSVL